MAGRAGRTGIDTRGESVSYFCCKINFIFWISICDQVTCLLIFFFFLNQILICKPGDIKRIAVILNDSCPPLQSCLSEDKNGMTHAIIEVVAGGIVQTAHDINRYVKCTLLNSTKPFQDVVKSAQESLRWLCQKKFLEWNDETKLYSTTPLGRAVFGSSLTPEESLVWFSASHDALCIWSYFILSHDMFTSLSSCRLFLMILWGQERVSFLHLICI